MLEGHAFVVEAAVSRGGRDLKPGINVYRFANRIPLLFEVRLCESPMPGRMHHQPPGALHCTTQLIHVRHSQTHCCKHVM